MGIHEDIMLALSKFQAAVGSALEVEVADAVKAKEQEVLDRDVYSYPASDFFMDTRRYDEADERGNFGLRSTANMQSHVENQDTLYVENTARSQSLWEDSTRPLTPIIEQGLLNYKPGPVHFNDTTEHEVIASGDVEIALAAGLRRQGY